MKNKHIQKFNEHQENLNTSDFYIVERRRDNNETEDANCFLSSSMDKVVDWINDNKDFDNRDSNWYWAVIKIKLDDEFGGEIFKYFDWDGNELDEQPSKGLSDVNESKLYNPHQMLPGYQYKITEPVYDDYMVGLKPEPYIVEVIKKMKHGVILRDVEHDFTFERTFQHLMTCEIEEVN